MRKFILLMILCLFLPSLVSSDEVESEIYEVRKNDTLAGLAKHFYNDPKKWEVIYNANRSQIKNPELLEIGWKLSIPSGLKWTLWQANANVLDLYPYNYMANNHLSGIYPELVTEVLKSIHISPKMEKTPWKDLKTQLTENKIQMAFPAIGDQDRFRKFILVDLYSIEIVLVSLKKANLSSITLSELATLKIGQIEGYSYFPAYNRMDLNRLSYPNNLSLLEGLSKEEVKVIIGDRVTLARLSKETGCYDTLNFHKTIFEIPCYVMFPPEHVDNARLFLKGLNTIKTNGRFDKILSSWN